ncbi:LOW QUALITY PROTEIN: protein sidekick-1-like [Plodia interpunctella]|uniref:LOW QUALITY PROTEIN: protein sidekick-1-like n=1 Tax=Plodia interpunctella TaxID=58824 RepID=UPI002368C045|nr:LOW QUALITY PROTEIN: protein sidekick-1-like [Plodia interpunctella]
MVAGPIKTDKRGWNQFMGVFILHLLFSFPYAAKAQSRAPRIKEHPADTIVGRSEPATLRCVSEGKPKPTIQWYKDGVPLAPTDHPHRVLLEDGLLFLRVMRGKKESDEGVYWCVARNSVGEAVSKNATLTIAVLRDEFRIEPRDVKVASGEPALLECSSPKGGPEPSVHWTKDGQSLDTEVNGRISVVNGGNLKILESLPSDSGVYRCVASNVAGERQSRPATLLVLRRPHFLVKPNNITALIGQNIEFHCQASPESDVSVTWSRDNGSLSPYAIIRRGSLRIDRVVASDAGAYTCRAESQAGSSATTAILTVNTLPYFTRVPSDQTVWEGEAVSFPCEAEGSPKPVVFWTMEGSQELVFPKSAHGTGSLYLDRVLTQHAGRLTCVAVSAAGSASHTATLQVLRREANSFKGDPELSTPQTELSKPQNHPPMTQYELVQARRYLQQDVLALRRVEGISSTTLKIVWDVMTDYNEYLEGVKIWFNGTSLNKKYLIHNANNSNDTDDSLANFIKYENFSMTTVHNSGSSSHILTGLLPYAQYDVFLMPFYKLLLGKPSNMKTGFTEEDIPTAPPQSLSAGVINATSAWIRWDPPPVHTWNGELSGYLIEVRVGGSPGGKVVGQMSLGARTRAAAASSLRAGGRYVARAAAVTRRGHGPFSLPAQIHMVPTQTQRHYVQTEPARDKAILSMFQETWLLALCVVLLVLIVIGSAVIVFIRRRNTKQRKSQNNTDNFISGAAIANAQQCLLGKEAVWLRERPLYEGSNEPRIEILNCHQSLLHGGHSIGTMAMEAEYTLPQHPHMNAMPQEEHRRIAPEPYATSAIYTELNYRDHTDAEDSCVKCAISPGSYDNSMVPRSYESNQYSNEECSTCCRSSSSTLTKEYSEMTKCGNDDEVQDMSMEDCPSCKTNHSRSSSHHDANKEWAVAELDYDYPQWHWLGKENSFRQGTQDMNRSNTGRSEEKCRMNLCDILPPPPYERETDYREMRAFGNQSGASACSSHSYRS